MTDRALAAALVEAERLEAATRAVWTDEGADLAEREAAHVVLRLTVPLKRSLVVWVTGRAIRAQKAG